MMRLPRIFCQRSKRSGKYPVGRRLIWWNMIFRGGLGGLKGLVRLESCSHVQKICRRYLMQIIWLIFTHFNRHETFLNFSWCSVVCRVYGACRKVSALKHATIWMLKKNLIDSLKYRNFQKNYHTAFHKVTLLIWDFNASNSDVSVLNIHSLFFSVRQHWFLWREYSSSCFVILPPTPHIS